MEISPFLGERVGVRGNVTELRNEPSEKHSHAPNVPHPSIGGESIPYSLSPFQELNQMLFPNEGEGMRSVAASARAGWNHEGAAMFHTYDFAFENAEFRRIDQIIGEVDCQQRRADLFQSRSWIVIGGGFQCV